MYRRLAIMRDRHRRRHELVLWLAFLCACSDDRKVIDNRPKTDFDNPTAIAGSKGGKGTAGSGMFLDGSCANGRITAARVSPKIILVVDGSCSMSTDYPANGAESASECVRSDRSRWTAIRNALVGGNGIVPKLEKV